MEGGGWVGGGAEGLHHFIFEPRGRMANHPGSMKMTQFHLCGFFPVFILNSSKSTFSLLL